MFSSIRSEDSFDDNSEMQSYCVRKEWRSELPKENFARTSTPIAELENNPASTFSDSVSDFFYQTWKNGLHSNDRTPTSGQQGSDQCPQQIQLAFQPVYFIPQVVYYNTVIYQTYPQYTYVQPIAYIPDGTYGIVINYWGGFENN